MSFDTAGSVSCTPRPLLSLMARMSRAFARPCSLNFAPTIRFWPRHSNESKVSIPIRTDSRLAAKPTRSSRTQSTIASAVSQRSVAAGEISTERRSLVITRCSETMSGPPHSPGPSIAPSGRNTARSGVRRSRHAVLRGVAPGTPVVSEEEAQGRGRGRGAVCAAAHSPVIKTIATTTISSFTAILSKIPRFVEDQSATPDDDSKRSFRDQKQIEAASSSTRAYVERLHGTTGWKLSHRILRCGDTFASRVRLDRIIPICSTGVSTQHGFVTRVALNVLQKRRSNTSMGFLGIIFREDTAAFKTGVKRNSDCGHDPLTHCSARRLPR
jgi:hypothetical protein